MEVDCEDDVLCVDKPDLNLTCKQLLELKEPKNGADILSKYEPALRDLESTITQLATLNDIPGTLPYGVQLLSSIAGAAILHMVSKPAVESYINCLLALNDLARREKSALVQRWVSDCFRRCLSCRQQPGEGKSPRKPSPDIFQLAALIHKFSEQRKDIPTAALATFLRSAIRVLERHSIYADKALHRIVDTICSIAQNDPSSLCPAVNEALCNLMRRGRLPLDVPLARNLLETCPAVLERLLLLQISQSLTPHPCGSAADDCRFFECLAECSIRSVVVFRRCFSILVTLYRKSCRESRIEQILLGFLTEVRSKVDSERWVLLFDEDLQPLIMMLQIPGEVLGDNLRREYGHEVSQLASRMLESEVLDTGSLAVIMHDCPPWMRECCNL